MIETAVHQLAKLLLRGAAIDGTVAATIQFGDRTTGIADGFFAALAKTVAVRTTSVARLWHEGIHGVLKLDKVLTHFLELIQEGLPELLIVVENEGSWHCNYRQKKNVIFNVVLSICISEIAPTHLLI